MTNGGFKFDIRNLKRPQDNTTKNNRSTLSEAGQAFDEAINYLHEFQTQKDANPEPLKKAAEKLLESLKEKSDNPEAFVLIAYIFYMFGNDKQALKYSKLAKMMAPDSSMVNKFRDFLNSSLPETETNKSGTSFSQTNTLAGERKILRGTAPLSGLSENNKRAVPTEINGTSDASMDLDID